MCKLVSQSDDFFQLTKGFLGAEKIKFVELGGGPSIWLRSSIVASKLALPDVL